MGLQCDVITKEGGSKATRGEGGSFSNIYYVAVLNEPQKAQCETDTSQKDKFQMNLVEDFLGPPLAHGDPAPLGPKECKLK